MNYNIPVYKVQLVRDPNSPKRRDRPQVTSPQLPAQILADYLEGADRENLVVIMLDTKNRIIGIHTVAVGTVNSSLYDIKDVMKPAILHNANAIIIGHNHPSGDPTPSPEDVSVTRRTIEAGKLLGIEVLDHIIIGDDGEFTSLKERGLGLDW